MTKRSIRFTARSAGAMAGLGALALLFTATTSASASVEENTTTTTTVAADTPTEDSGSVVPLPPKRVYESRKIEGEGTFDNKQEMVGTPAAKEVITVDITGRGIVPDTAKAVFLNVTAAFAQSDGFLTVFPCGAEQPSTSNVNYLADDVSPNAVLSGLSEDGKVCVYTEGVTDVVVDVNGYVPASSPIETVVPIRLYDTRSDGKTFDNNQVNETDPGDGVEFKVNIAGRGDIPENVSAAFLNVTSAFANDDGYLVAYPCTEGAPENSSNVNYFRGDTSPNSVLAKVDDNGDVCIKSFGSTNVVVDLNGYVPTGTDITTISPIRLYSTFTDEGETTVDNDQQMLGKAKAGSVAVVNVGGRAGIPEELDTAFLNVTSANGEADGFFTVYPCDAEGLADVTGPDATIPTEAGSHVNYFKGDVAANAVVSKVSAEGTVCVYNLTASDILVDLVGFTSTATYPPAGDTTTTSTIAEDTTTSSTSSPGA